MLLTVNNFIYPCPPHLSQSLSESNYLLLLLPPLPSLALKVTSLIYSYHPLFTSESGVVRCPPGLRPHPPPVSLWRSFLLRVTRACFCCHVLRPFHPLATFGLHLSPRWSRGNCLLLLSPSSLCPWLLSYYFFFCAWSLDQDATPSLWGSEGCNRSSSAPTQVPTSDRGKHSLRLWVFKLHSLSPNIWCSMPMARDKWYGYSRNRVNDRHGGHQLTNIMGTFSCLVCGTSNIIILNRTPEDLTITW